MILQKLCSKAPVSAIMILGATLLAGCSNTYNSADTNYERPANEISINDNQNIDNEKTSNEKTSNEKANKENAGNENATEKNTNDENAENSANANNENDANVVSQETAIEKKLPVLIDHEYQFTLNGMSELSGICLSEDGEVIWGADDDGTLYEIQLANMISKTNDSKYEIAVNNKTKVYSISADDNLYTAKIVPKKNRHGTPNGLGMEGMAMDSEGNLYVGLEQENKAILKIKKNDSGYVFEDGESDSPEKMISFSSNKYGNNGIEGITWFRRNNEQGFYLGTQKNVLLFQYDMNGNKLRDEKSLLTADGWENETFINDSDLIISEIAGLDYDEENDWLWVIDSETFKIYLFNGDGSKLLTFYDISDMIENPKKKTQNNPEGLCIDKKRGCIWVCEDKDNSVLHRYNFENL